MPSGTPGDASGNHLHDSYDKHSQFLCFDLQQFHWQHLVHKRDKSFSRQEENQNMLQLVEIATAIASTQASHILNLGSMHDSKQET